MEVVSKDEKNIGIGGIIFITCYLGVRKHGEML
jgi:hypothetical protein